MPGVNFAVVREQISMADVLRLLRFAPARMRGDQLRGPCPVHESRGRHSRSFSVNVRRGRYHCFRCGSRGNALELWAAARKLTLPAAAIELCELLGMDVPWIQRW
ncbi:MAG: CHC2 zinc finger domain-containing protein [Dehalococcoidia bacterium]